MHSTNRRQGAVLRTELLERREVFDVQAGALCDSPALDASTGLSAAADSAANDSVIRDSLAKDFVARDWGAASDSAGENSQALIEASREPRSAAVEGDVLVNGGFESGLTGWQRQGGVTLTLTPDAAHSGARGVRITNRTAAWNGIGQNILGKVTPGLAYRYTAWVKLATPGSHNLSITISQLDGAGQNYFFADNTTVTDQAWVKLEGVFRAQVTGTLQTLFMYIEGPPPGVNIYADDFSIVPFQDDSWREAANARIEQIRKRDVDVKVVDQDGNAISGAALTIEQTRNLFGFGTAIATNALDNPRYRDFLQQHFQWGVVENAVKWQSFEPQQGVFNYADADEIVQFAKQIGMPLRGHNIFWEVEQFVPDWVRALNDTDLRAAVSKRIQDVVGRYANDFVHWDVNNEMLHGDYFERRLGPNIRADMFKEAQALAPQIEYFVNDYNVVAGGETLAYKAQIEGLLAQGAPVEAIGAQGHFNEVAPDLMLSRLDTLAELGLPIWFTEFDVVQADPVERAKQVETFYRLAFSHPAVEGVLMWGFWAGAHWRGPNAALVDEDWTINAAGQAYLNLMEEWSTETAGTTNAAGELDFRGFHGDYVATVTLPDGSKQTYNFSVNKGATAEVVELVVNTSNARPNIALADLWQLTRSVPKTFTVTVGDDETPVENLRLTVSSDNGALFPPSAIVVSGSGAERQVTLSPKVLQTGEATLTFELRDADGAVTTAKTSAFVVTPNRTENILPNGGFESGQVGPMRPTALSVAVGVQSAITRSGSNAALVSNRGQTWEGIAYDLNNSIKPGEQARITAYVRLRNASSSSVGFTISQGDDRGATYQALQWSTATNTAWTRLSGVFTYNPVGPPTHLVMYLEGPAAGIDFYVDDVSITLLNGVRDGDIDGNGLVDLKDFAVLRRNFGLTSAARNLGDLDGDGKVDLKDFSILRKYFGR